MIWILWLTRKKSKMVSEETILNEGNVTMPQVRDGSDKISNLARILIQLCATFGGALKAKYPPPSAVATLIDAIAALGTLLPAADAQMLDYGGTNAPVLDNPETITGINPAADAPPVFVPPEP